MPVCRIQHTYNHISGEPRDGIVNTFHFDSGTAGPALTTAIAESLAGNVIDFYDEVPPTAIAKVREYIGEKALATARHTVKAYDMSQPEPRVPIYQNTTMGALASNATNPLPSEVAICLSYRGTVISGMNPARRRGRVYIGPLNSTSLTTDAQFNARPNATMQNTLCLAGKELARASSVDLFPWVVRHGLPVVAGMYPQIVHCWVDNAFDTQRRRGVDSNSRLTQSFIYAPLV